MIENLLSKQSEANLNSPTNEVTPQLSYFDVISNQLDAWDGKQQAIREAKAQLTKAFLIQDVDEVTGQSSSYKVTLELLKTEQVNVLELPELSTWGSEVDYAN